MSKPAFKMPDREKRVDDWVVGAGEGASRRSLNRRRNLG
jgi:hypothetical protein